MEFEKGQMIVAGVAIFFLLLDLIVFYKNPNLMYFIGILIFVLASAPFVYKFAIGAKIQREKESRFLEFARDLVESVRSGTPINSAIHNLRKRDYGVLSPHVQKLSNQLDIGITLTGGLINFANDTGSRVISRAVGLIAEAERSGGEIDTILNSVANSVNQIEELKKEQTSAVYNLVVQGYIIFIVFILIILVLQYYILPMVSGAGSSGIDLNETVAIRETADLSRPLLILLLVQSFFAGLVIGKIAEGNVKDGIKHSFILLTIALVVSFGAKLLFSA
jgi:flagellar protein FlaJ